MGAAAVCYRCWLRADLETPLGWSWAAAVCYRSWLRADLETLSQWPLADNFAEMQRKGPEPDVITYSALINACAKGDYAGETMQLLVERQRKGLEPNVITSNALFNACSQGGIVEKALQILAEMSGGASGGAWSPM